MEQQLTCNSSKSSLQCLCRNEAFMTLSSWFPLWTWVKPAEEPDLMLKVCAGVWAWSSVCSLQHVNMRAERKLATLHSCSTAALNRTEVPAALYTGCAASLTDSWWREAGNTHWSPLLLLLLSAGGGDDLCRGEKLSCPDDPQRLKLQQFEFKETLTGSWWWTLSLETFILFIFSCLSFSVWYCLSLWTNEDELKLSCI